MTHLRQTMLEELRRRNYAESTIRAYIGTVAHFSQYFHRPPDQLGPEHIRQYQAALFTRWKLQSNTVIQKLAALRFLYVHVLNPSTFSTISPAIPIASPFPTIAWLPFRMIGFPFAGKTMHTAASRKS